MHPSHPGDRSRRWQRLLSTLCALPLLAPIGCEAETTPIREIGAGVVLADGHFPLRATSAQRFGFSIPQASDPLVDAAPAGQSHGPDYLWETPDGWTELPPSRYRQINFRVAGDESTECYLTVLEGDGGGLAANVNRWRQQMQLAPLDLDALAALPEGELLGVEATGFDATGTFAGMSGDGNAEDSRMIGLLAFSGSEALFLKMVGPAHVVTAEEGAFWTLARSLRDAHAGHNHDATAANDSSAEAAPLIPQTAQVSPASMTTGGGLSWDIPAGWQVTAPLPMRLINFDLGGGVNQCYISILGGDGGGTMKNVNRWRQQMGQPPLGLDEFAGLERIPMLEGTALTLEIEGPYQGMGSAAIDDALMLGVIRELPERTVFVKMIGDRDALTDHQGTFYEFCQSIRFAAGS